MGKYNSSITRVWPVFGELLKREPSGKSWLGGLLNLCSENREYASRLASTAGALCHQRAKDGHVCLEKCLEFEGPPPSAFLRWLIRQPEQMQWPKGKRYSRDTQQWREKLMGMHGKDAIVAAKQEAEKMLHERGSKGSKRKWWIFEGFTSVDCCLQTDNLILFIEGKRTETAQSRSTDWYPCRDQIIRNLEAAKEMAAGKDYAVMVITEKKPCQITADDFKNSLPHMSQEERDEIASHYLGCTTWKDVCCAVGINYSGLPDTVDEALAKQYFR